MGGTAVAGLLLYFGYLKYWDPATNQWKFKKADKAPETPAAPVVTAPASAPKPAPAPAAPKPAPAPAASTGGFAPKPVVRKIGDKLRARVATNAYKTASAGSGNIYKYYAAGETIGTYLGINGSFTEVLVPEAGWISVDYKTVYVLTSDIIA